MSEIYLARRSGPMAVELLDGAHSTPEGVAKAAKLTRQILRNPGPFVMVEVSDVPDVDVPINEEAARTCAEAVDRLHERHPFFESGEHDG